jgi:hypothetical protein
MTIKERSDLNALFIKLAALIGYSPKVLLAGFGDTLAGAAQGTALTDAASIATDGSSGGVFTVTLGGNRTLANPTNLATGGTYVWVIRQDATGSRTLSYGSLFKFPGGTAPTLTTTASAVDVLSAVYDGTQLNTVFQGNFS